MKVKLGNGIVYPYGLTLNFKEGGKVELTYHDKQKVINPKRKEDVDRYRYIVKTVLLDSNDVTCVSDYSGDEITVGRRNLTKS